MTNKKKADQQASLKKTPPNDTSSQAQRLIAPPAADSHSPALLDGIDCLPFGTMPKQE
jgi:hypothetical protein